MRGNKPKRRWVYLTLFAGWLVWISGVFGNSGLIQAYKLSQVRRDLSLRVVALENEKQRLQSSLQGLENDPYVQELTIRETLGFVRDSELIFEFR
jgi:cell division protein FtsB